MVILNNQIRLCRHELESLQCLTDSYVIPINVDEFAQFIDESISALSSDKTPENELLINLIEGYRV